MRQVTPPINRVILGLRNRFPHPLGVRDGDGAVLLPPDQQRWDARSPHLRIDGVEHRHLRLIDCRQQRAAESAILHLNAVAIDPIREPGRFHEIR